MGSFSKQVYDSKNLRLNQWDDGESVFYDENGNEHDVVPFFRNIIINENWKIFNLYQEIFLGLDILPDIAKLIIVKGVFGEEIRNEFKIYIDRLENLPKIVAQYNLILFIVLYIYYNPHEWNTISQFHNSEFYKYLRLDTDPRRIYYWEENILSSDIIKGRKTPTYIHNRKELFDEFEKYRKTLNNKVVSCPSISDNPYMCRNVYRDGLGACFYKNNTCSNYRYNTNVFSNKEVYTTITGLVELTEISIFGKHIYLFGEEHGITHTSPTRDDSVNFIDILLSLPNYYPNKKFDYFFETPLENETFGKNNYSRRSESKLNNLSAVLDVFDNCLNKNIDRCPYKNVKFHSIDVRQTLYGSDNKNFFNHLFDLSLELISNPQMFKEKIQFIYNLFGLNLDDNNSSEEIDQVADLFLERLTSETKIGQYLDLFDDENLKTFIIEYFNESLRSKIKYLFSKEEDDKIRKSALIRIGAVVVDFYTITCMFCKGETLSNNYIMYAGAAHTMNVFELLRRYKIKNRLSEITIKRKIMDEFGTMPAGTFGEKAQLDMSNFNQPFFNKY